MAFPILQTLLVVFLASLAAAYFEVDIQGIEQLSDTKYADFTKIKIRKDREAKVRKYYGNVSFNIEMDNSYKETMLLYVKQGGEYRKMSYKLPEKGICDFLNDDAYFYPEFTEYSDLPLPLPCPIPTGVFEVRGV